MDPRFAALPLGIQDPRDAQIARLWQGFAALSGRVDALEKTPTVQETAGSPVQASRNGTLAVDTSAARLWVRRNGSWVFTTTSA